MNRICRFVQLHPGKMVFTLPFGLCEHIHLRRLNYCLVFKSIVLIFFKLSIAYLYNKSNTPIHVNDVLLIGSDELPSYRLISTYTQYQVIFSIEY